MDITGLPAGTPPGEPSDGARQRTAGGVEADQPPAAEAPSPVTAVEGAQPSPKHRKPRKLLYVTLPGCWGALIAGCLSFTPSLLPRGGIVLCGDEYQRR